MITIIIAYSIQKKNIRRDEILPGNIICFLYYNWIRCLFDENKCMRLVNQVEIDNKCETDVDAHEECRNNFFPAVLFAFWKKKELLERHIFNKGCCVRLSTKVNVKHPLNQLSPRECCHLLVMDSAHSPLKSMTIQSKRNEISLYLVSWLTKVESWTLTSL